MIAMGINFWFNKGTMRKSLLAVSQKLPVVSTIIFSCNDNHCSVLLRNFQSKEEAKRYLAPTIQPSQNRFSLEGKKVQQKKFIKSVYIQAYASHLRDFQLSEQPMPNPVLMPLGVIEAGTDATDAEEGDMEEDGDAIDTESIVEDEVLLCELLLLLPLLLLFPLPFLRRRG